MADSQYSRKSLRLTDYDYTTPGAYFITLCTKDHACMSGSIEEGTMHPSTAGLLADVERETWRKSGSIQ